MSERPDLSLITDEQLKDELRSRGYALSIWSKEDVISLIHDDEDCAHLTDEQLQEAAQIALDEMGHGLENVLAERGNDYTADRWYGDLRGTVLAAIKDAAPKA